eukprot:6664438-Alexandrium_andersonii.AAC.1
MYFEGAPRCSLVASSWQEVKGFVRRAYDYASLHSVVACRAAMEGGHDIDWGASFFQRSKRTRAQQSTMRIIQAGAL